MRFEFLPKCIWRSFIVHKDVRSSNGWIGFVQIKDYLHLKSLDIMNTRPRASSDKARQRAASTSTSAKLPTRDVTEPTPLQALLAMQADKLLPEGMLLVCMLCGAT